MEIPRFSPLDDDNAPFNSEEFEAGYVARLAGQSQCVSATHGWRAGWAEADAGFNNPEILKAS
jgi:hypothetical protein